MKYENLEFREALKLLAGKAGVTLPQYKAASPQEQSEKELLYRINDFAARYYHQILMSDKRGQDALEYLKKRGLTEGTIKKWQIGFAPEEFHSLEQALAQKKVSVAELVKAGVSAKNERGQIYDRFRGRITFPIFDHQGNTVGFSARIFRDDGKSAKYVNSPETVIYSKSKVLFGFNFAKNAIRKADEAVIVEGQMDVIAPHQAGFENVVASSGTALTPEQLALLGRLTKNLKFCFDADTAGQAASRRAGELALKQGFRLKVIVLEKVKDPDELIKKGPGLWEKAVSEAQWFLDWQMSHAAVKFADDVVEQKHFLSEAVVPLLAVIADPLEQDHYVRRLVEKFSISERTVREQIRKYLSGGPVPASPAARETAVPVSALEKELLGGMLLYPDFAQQVLGQAAPEEFADPAIQQIVKQLQGGQQDAVKQETVAKEAVFMVESARESLEGGDEQQLRELKKSFAIFKIASLKKLQQQLTADIRKAENFGEKNALHTLTKLFADYSAQRMEFEKLI
jgi:DNA primase